MLKSFTIFIAALILVAVTDSILVAQINFWEQTNGPYGGLVNSLAINASGHIFAETDSGLFRSTNNGDNWTRLIQIRYPSAEYLAINSSGHIFTYEWIFPGPGQLGVLFKRSTDNGDTWVELPANHFGKMAVNASDHIFVGGNGVSRSTDNGNTWTHTGLTNTYVRALAINSNGHIFAADTRVWRSTDNGETWAKLDSGWSSILDFTINATGHIFAGTYGSGVFRSTDNGTSWDSVNTSLTNRSVYALAINSHGHIFAGTYGGGVFLSIDNGDNWAQINSGLTNLDVASLALSHNGYIFAGTGSGVFRSVESTTSVRELSPAMPAAFALEQNYPNPFNPSTEIQFSLPQKTHVTLTIFDLLGREVTTLVFEELSAGSHSERWHAVGFPSGVYFYTLTASEFTQTKKLLLVK